MFLSKNTFDILNITKIRGYSKENRLGFLFSVRILLYLDYICVDEMGNIITPSYLTESFSKLLAHHGMRHIRFHDLRHTCASMLLENGVPMKQIQEWLGHSDFSTTANIYARLDYNAKLNSADAMISGMSGALNFVS